MKKIFIFLSIFATFNIKAQSYSESIIAHRQGYKDEFLKDASSPVKAEDMKYFDFFEPDSTFRVKCDFTKTNSQTTFIIPTINGKQKEYFRYGILNFKITWQPLGWAIQHPK